MFATGLRYLTNQRSFRDTDVFLASYTRSGNTWMRLLLSDLILQIQGEDTDTGGNVIPDVYKVDLKDWDRDSRINQLSFRIIKTHEPYETRFSRAIFLFRNPADSLCSYYHYRQNVPEYSKGDGTLDVFCHSKVDEWCWHTKSYLSAQETNPENFIFISYESLAIEPISRLKEAANFLGLTVTENMCQKAVANQKFAKLRTLAASADAPRMGFWENVGYQTFFRKGEVNSSLQELSTETIELLQAKALPIYKQARTRERILT